MTTSPIRFARSLFGSVGLAAIVGLYALAGCSGGGTPDEGASSSSSSSSGGQGTGSGSEQAAGTPSGSGSGSGSGSEEDKPGSSTSPPTTTSNAPSCQNEDGCPNWFCECEEGPPVNTRHCTNGRCEDAAVACPKSCKAFGTCWIGQAGGGWQGGTNSGPSDC